MKVYDQDDTIAAVSTPSGEGGIGIIRLSGRDSLPIALNIFQAKNNKKAFKSHRLYLGEIINPSTREVLDECLISYMKAPRSFTREDVLEFHCHGGTVVLQSVMELILRAGAREAGPGEFTKRAFLNGRLDLSQAESIIDIIRAKTERSLRLAQTQLKGGLKDALDGVKKNLTKALSILEAYIDFPEDEIDPNLLEAINSNINLSITSIKELLNTYEEGRILREGIHVVIAGRPNVGKSSLLNALLKEKRAIVTSVPGTTRDVIEEVINIKGIPVNLIDTAGIRKTEDLVEGEGIKRTREKLKEADIVLYMADEKGIDADDLKVITEAGERKIIVINKTDLIPSKLLNDIKNRVLGIPIVALSLANKLGLEELKESLYREVMSHGADTSPQVIISRKRQKVSLERSLHSLGQAVLGIREARPYELITIDIRDALTNISELTGETTPDDILNRIFGEFCIGK